MVNQFDKKSSKPIGNLLGTYYEPIGNVFFTIFLKDKKLILENDWIKSELKIISEDTFRAVNQKNLMLVRMKESAINIETEYFTADVPKIEPLKLGAKQLEEFTGSYISQKLKQKIHLTVYDSNLTFNLAVGKQFVKPIIQDTFINGYLQLKFYRKNHEIISVSLNTIGAKEIIFEKYQG